MTIASIAPPAALMLDDAMARHYTPRIRRHAARFARRLPRHMAVADLVSAGFTGLVDACLRFDHERVNSFEAYLDHRIRGAMLDELRERDPLTRDQRAFARKLSTATQRLSHRLGRAPSEEETALELQLSVPALRDQLTRLNESAMRGAASTGEQDLHAAAGDEFERPDTLLEMRERRHRMDAAMNRLPERQRMALKMYYDDDMTLREIAGVMGVTESRVSQIHAEAIAKLRGMLTDA